MPTSPRSAVSVHTLVILASGGGRPIRSEDLAIAIGTNAAVVRALLARLAASGLTTAQLGNGGGALLKRPADTITLLDVYRAVQDGAIFNFPRSLPDDPDMIGRHILASLEKPLRAAREAMERKLSSVTIEEIFAQIRLLENGPAAPALDDGDDRHEDR